MIDEDEDYDVLPGDGEPGMRDSSVDEPLDDDDYDEDDEA